MSQAGREDQIAREEFEKFLHAFTHELRNKLNGIALEAADLAEQIGKDADARRLQQQVQACSAFLKEARDALAPDQINAVRMGLADFIRDLKKK
jgi:signal transduction histidine kinase